MNFGEFKSGMDRLAAAHLKVLKEGQLAHWFKKFRDCHASDFHRAVSSLEDEDRFPSAGRLKRAIQAKARNSQMLADAQEAADEGSGWDAYTIAQFENTMAIATGRIPYAEGVEIQNRLFDEHGRNPDFRLTGVLVADHENIVGYRKFKEGTHEP